MRHQIVLAASVVRTDTYLCFSNLNNPSSQTQSCFYYLVIATVTPFKLIALRKTLNLPILTQMTAKHAGMSTFGSLLGAESVITHYSAYLYGDFSVRRQSVFEGTPRLTMYQHALTISTSILRHYSQLRTTCNNAQLSSRNHAHTHLLTILSTIQLTGL